MRKLWTLFTLGVILLSPAAINAQIVAPGRLGLTPLSNPNQVMVLDSTGTWVPIGSINPATHVFTVSGGTSGLPNQLPIGVSLYPTIVPPANTTATTTSGSPNITVTSATGINLGDVAYAGSGTAPPSFAPPYCVNGYGGQSANYVVSISGNNLVMSCNSSATNVSPVSVQFGQARYDPNSSLIANTIGAQTIYVGPSSQGHTNSWLPTVIHYTDSLLSPSLMVLSQPGGGSAIKVGARTSDATGSFGTFGESVFFLADTWASVVGGEAFYVQSSLSAVTAGSTNHIQFESSIQNYWPYTSMDPYNGLSTNATANFWIDCGTGFTTPVGNNCSTAIAFTSNGAKYGAGITFENTALDTAGGTIEAPALSLPLLNSIRWYSAAATPSAAIYSDVAGNLKLSVVPSGTFSLVNGSINMTQTAGTHPLDAQPINMTVADTAGTVHIDSITALHNTNNTAFQFLDNQLNDGLQLQMSNTGFPKIAAVGIDGNISITLMAKGTGAIITNANSVQPLTTDITTLGSSGSRWSAVYGVAYFAGSGATAGATCNAGISNTTARSVAGIVTVC